jgi:class 3 adenylate cyclase/tetratricopeptide (TPR) repeat protein
MSAGDCGRCGAGNVPSARFCMACGAPLARTCPSCGAGAEIQARFCNECGTPLDVRDGEAADALVASEERRTVTVLFADIVSYTTLAERLDHESVKSLTDRYLTRLALEVERFGGYVDQYIGDNVMAVFGAPIAHEDDAERAVRAASAMQAAMAELNRSAGADFGVELSLRVGVNTGEVLAGRIGGEYTVVGDTVNVAARLQSAASVGRILVGERTRRSTAAGIAYRQVGPLMLKGKTNPVNAWEVLAAEAQRGPREPQPARTRLIGRRPELARLLAVSDQVGRERLPHLVAVIGEAGIGKTRLLQELEHRLKRRVPRTYFLCGRALGFGAQPLFGPLAEMLRGECAIGHEDDEQLIREKLVRRLGPLLAPAATSEQVEQRLAPFARLLGVDVELDGEGAAGLDLRSARDSFFGMVRTLFEALSADHVPVVVWEDAHWADEGTFELIDYLDEWVQAPLLQVCVGREELLDRSGWTMTRRRSECIFLEALPPQQARELVDALIELGAGAGPEGTESLAERCGGNPLFAEALIDRLKEADSDADELPDTVRGVLAARLDALPTVERQLLGHASVVGLRFSRSSLLGAVSAGTSLSASIALLREKNLITLTGAELPGGEPGFAFRHPLIREVAYEMLPRALRARKHAQLARAIEGARGEAAEVRAGILAEHFTRAAALAAEAHLPAGELADIRRGALASSVAAGDEAASLFSNGQALERYRAASGFAEPGEEVIFEIAEKCGDVEARLGRMGGAIADWEVCLAHHHERGDLEHAAEMHRKIAASLVHQGDREAAIKQLQRGINMVKERPASHALARLYGEAADVYMELGANMLATYSAERALRLAEQLGEASAASRAHEIYGRVFGRIGDVAKARESLERAVALARESNEEETILALIAAGRNLEQCEGAYEAAGERYAEALALAERIGALPLQIELRSALAQLALYRCDWEAASRESELVATLAESEGLVSKLCLSDALTGRLRWREGDWDASLTLITRARDGAAGVGRPEVGAQAMLSLADTLCDRGELDSADAALREAITICEGAALTPQATQAWAALAHVNAMAGHDDDATDAARYALQLAGRVHDPVSQAAAAEAEGLTAQHENAIAALERAQLVWETLGRPLDAARCLAQRAVRTHEWDPAGAGELARQAAARFEELGLVHPAGRCRTPLRA